MKHIIASFLISMAIVVMTGPASAGKDKEPFEWEQITSDQWEITPDSAKGIFDAVVVFEKVLADDKKIEKEEFYRTLYRRIRILSAAGRDWANVEVPHLNREQKVEQVYARAVQRDGSVTKMTEEHVFEKEVVKTKDEKIKQKTFSIPGVTDDCIIEYAIKYKLPSSESEWIIQQEIPVLAAQMRWIPGSVAYFEVFEAFVMKYFVPNWLFLNTYSRPKIDERPSASNPETLVFDIGFVPRFESEPYSIPEIARKTRLYCYYGSDGTPMEHWGDVSEAIEEAMRELCKKKARVEEVVKRWENLETDSAKIAAAYRWVQESILNLTYEDLLDENGKERKPKDNKSFDDIIKNGYGTRSEIDLLFCDLLREMKINAKVAFLKDRIDDLFIREAKYWQMNRSLVVVEAGPGKFEFYTPGHPHTPFDMVPWFCEGVEAVVGGASEYIGTVPFSPSTATQSNIAYQLRLNEDLEVEGSLSARLTGHDGRTMRMALNGEERADFDNLLKEELAEYVPDAELDSIKFESLDNCHEPFRVTCAMTFPAVSQSGNRILLKPLDYVSESDNPFTDPERVSPVLFRYARQLNESAEFEIPEGYTIEALPQDAMFQNAVGSCTVKFVKMGNMLAAQRFFTLKSPFWGVDRYPQVQALFQARMDMSSEMVVLTKTN